MQTEPDPPKFEEVYPRYEFAPLVTLALSVAEWIKKRLAKTRGSLSGAILGHVLGVGRARRLRH